MAAFALPFRIVTVVGFIAGLVITLAASELLARGLTRLGTKMGFSEGLLGLLAALGADSPELSSAVVAILAGAGNVGVGVVVGSNLFNLAALLGLSAIVARGVMIRRGPLILDAAVGLLMLAAAGVMVAGLISPVVAVLFAIPLAVVYVLIVSRPAPVDDDLPAARKGSWLPVALLPVAVAGVVGGSFVMVHEALLAQPWLHLSDAVLGSLVLAALTSLPNLWVALHFARTNRGTALFSAAMNSNSINLVGGLMVPALFFGLGAAHGSLPYFTWLIVLTLLAVLAPLARGRLSPAVGGLIIAIYLVFAALRVL